MDPGVLDATPAVGFLEYKLDYHLMSIDDPQYSPASIRRAGGEGAGPEASQCDSEEPLVRPLGAGSVY
jgi:hypothetical protein